MKEIFKMTVSGLLSAANPTPNKCVVEGHSAYAFEAVLVFPGNTPLDVNGFLIDTAEVKRMITEAPLTGSCEQMHLQLKELFCSRLPEVLAFRTTIKPDESCRGWIDFVFSNYPLYYSIL